VRRLLIRSGAPALVRGRVTAFFVAASLIGFVTVVPWRSLTKYHRYRGISADVARLARTHNFGNALVFVQQTRKEDYVSAFIFNPTILNEKGPIYVLDIGSASREILSRHFSDRTIWFLGRSHPDEVHLHVLAGPLPAGNVLPGQSPVAISNPGL
jgi:hypothetical protein